MVARELVTTFGHGVYQGRDVGDGSAARVLIAPDFVRLVPMATSKAGSPLFAKVPDADPSLRDPRGRRLAFSESAPLRTADRDCEVVRLAFGDFRKPLAQIVGVHDRHELGRGV